MAKAKKSIEQEIMEYKKPEAVYLTTGNTLRDLQIGGDTGCMGYKVGCIYNLVGDSSSGKCIKNACVITSNGIEYIDDIGKDVPYGITAYTEKLALEAGKQVEASHFYKEKVPGTIKVEMENCFSIEGTPEHPIAIWTEQGIKMTKLKDVHTGDVVVSSGNTQMYGDYQPMPQVDVSELAHNAYTEFNLPPVVDEEFARMLGCLVADGNLIGGAISISNTREWFSDFIYPYFTRLGFSVRKSDSGVVVSSVYLVALLKMIFDNPEEFTARNKFVPKCILKSPKSVQAQFLQGLIDCDSSIDIVGEIINSIEYTTASKRLMNEVRLMLLNMGIPTSVYIKDGAYANGKFYDHVYYRVVIHNSALHEYKAVISSAKYNFNLPINTVERSPENRVPFANAIINTTIDEIRDRIGWCPNGRCAVCPSPKWKPKYVSDTRKSIATLLEMYGHLWEYFPEEYPCAFFEELLSKQYCFNKIISIEHIDEETDVYDFHVPDGHLFLANGIINHNTLLAIQGVVANTVRLGDKFVYAYDDAENGCTFDIQSMYGVDFPLITEEYRSHTVEDLYNNIRKFSNSLKKNQSGMYVVDSLDGLTSKATQERADERFDKFEKGREFNDGTYGTDKARYLSQEFFPDIASRIKDTNVVLIIISQVRDKINASMFEKKQDRSGGKALQFYCHTVEWLAGIQKKETEDDTTGLRSGGVVLSETTKSKTKRPYRKAVISFDFSIGVDDIATCVDFLYDLRKNKDGSVSKTYSLRPTKRDKIMWDEQLYTRDELIDFIYDNELEEELRKRTIDKWESEESKLVNRRTPRL